MPGLKIRGLPYSYSCWPLVPSQSQTAREPPPSSSTVNLKGIFPVVFKRILYFRQPRTIHRPYNSAPEMFSQRCHPVFYARNIHIIGEEGRRKGRHRRTAARITFGNIFLPWSLRPTPDTAQQGRRSSLYEATPPAFFRQMNAFSLSPLSVFFKIRSCFLLLFQFFVFCFQFFHFGS